MCNKKKYHFELQYLIYKKTDNHKSFNFYLLQEIDHCATKKIRRNSLRNLSVTRTPLPTCQNTRNFRNYGCSVVKLIDTIICRIKASIY